MSYKRDSNIFVGGTIGTIKGVQFYKDDNQWKACSKNLKKVGALGAENGITAMCWGDDDEVDILIGLENMNVTTYDTDYKAFTSSVNVKYGEGKICGLSKYDRSLLTAVESGHIRTWRFREKEGDIFNTGHSIEKMKHSKTNKNIVAIGSKNSSDLKLLDLSTKQFTFTSKNVRPNHLQLQVGIWPSDIVFLPNSDSLVAVCTRYGQIRLYDIRAQKRPAASVEIPGVIFTAMSATMKDRCVVVGSGRGELKLIEFGAKAHVAKSYRGPLGCIRSIACSATEPYVVSASLDAHMYIHHMNTSELLYKSYQKTGLNCVLVRSQMILPDINEESKQGDQENNSDNDVEIVAEYDDLFDGMITLEES